MLNFKKGFSMVEILVVLAVLMILIAIVLPSFNTMRDNQILQSASSDISSVLDKARSNSLSSINSSEYGVHFESNKVVIFKGTVFSSSDPDNEDVLISSPAYISDINLTGGATELYFDRLSGAPNKTGSITVSLSSASKVVSISATGSVSVD